MYDIQSQGNLFEIGSQFNDIHVQIASQNGKNPSSDLNRHTLGEGKKEDPHPFNGPKLHLFRKGKAKSSQMK